MPSLYNCRHDGDLYRITKFNDDMNPEGSYLTDGKECDCPAGIRPTCRHRQMLPRFLDKGHIGDEWFFDYDRGGWVQMGPEWLPPKEVSPTYEPPVWPDEVQAHDLSKPIESNPPSFDGTTYGDPEPAPTEVPPAPRYMKRRFL